MFENFQNYFDYLSDRIIPDIIYNMGVTLGAMLIFTYFTINTFFIFPLETIYEEFSDDGYLRQMMGDLFYYVVLFPANMIPDTILVILQLAVYSGFFILNMTFREIFFRLIILIFIIIPCNIILLIKNFINPDKLSENCGNFNVSTQPYRFSFNVSAF